MVEIYINNQLVDSEGSNVSETKQINNFFEIKDRQTSYTNSFKLPMTPKNKSILKFFGVIGNQSDVPYKVHDVTISRHGIQTVQNGIGYVQVISFTNNIGYYLLNVQSDNIDFYNTIEGKFLNQLDFSELNHSIVNWETYTTKEDGFTYPLIDSGYLHEDNVVQANYQLPCVYYKWFFDKIFEDSGYEYYYAGRVNIFESDDFTKRVLTVDKSIYTYLGKTPVFTNIASFKYDNVIDVGTKSVYLNEISDVNDIHVTIVEVGVYKSIIEADEDGFYKINIRDIVSDNAFYISFIKNNIYYEERVLINGTTNTHEVTVYLTSSDVLEIEIHKSLEENINVSFDTYISYSESDYNVNFKNYYDKAKQKTFIKSVMQDYGLLHQKDRDGKYAFITINDLFFRNDNKVDWSHKFNSINKIDTRLSTYGKENILQYSYEEDETFADGSFFLNNETLKEEALMFKNFTRASKKSQRFNSLPLYKVPFWVKDEFQEDSIIEEESPNIYSLLIDKNSASFTYNLNGVEYNYSGLINVGVFRNLSYNTLVSKYYNIYSIVLNNYQKINATLKLNTIDIYSLDFLKLYYIEQLAGYFYLNKVSNYKGKETTNVELVRIASIDVNGEYNNDYNNDYNNF